MTATPRGPVTPTTPPVSHRRRASGLPGDQPTSQDIAANLPPAMRVGAAIAWRFVVIAAALYVLGKIFSELIELVVPVAIALLLAALLSPAVARLVRWGVARAWATAIVLIGGLAAVGGLLTFVITRFVNGLPALRAQVSEAIDKINHWLTTGPLHLTDSQVQKWLTQAQDSIKGNQGEVASQVLDTAVTIGRLAGGAALCIFCLIFFLHDGDRIWRFLTRIVPYEHRDRVDLAGRRGFAALGHYVRATVVVAMIDATSIGVGLAIIGVPLAVPLSALIFLGAFVPILGAFVTGTVAVMVALVANGVVSALVVLGLLIAVMQVEGHVLQPLLLGRAVRLHPLAVVLGIGVGLTLAGIPGALLAVPLLAVLNASVRSLLSDADAEVDPEEIDPNAPGEADPADADDDSGGALGRLLHRS
ncbi:MAG TPA: AI-2E family transporter [Sporichthyaceae bacterium]|nr:AI-2E family transporter [Sporichthyaceae bacterium]